MSLPERTCVRVLSECMGRCMGVCWCVCKFPCPFAIQALPALHRVRTPSSSQSRFSRRGKFSPERACAGGRSSCTPSAHHSPSVTCAAAPSVAGLPLQRAYFLAAIDLWLSSPLGAPGSALPAPGCRLPPGRTWKSGAGRLKPRPPTQRGEWSAPHPRTANPVPTQK